MAQVTRPQINATLALAAKRFGRSQPHGFGFTMIGSDGSVASGRYLTPATFAGFRCFTPAWVKSEKLETGRLPKTTVALIVHGRTSTNEIRIENVHPFKRAAIHLAHNGILDWIGKGASPTARHNCDSEKFLNWLTESGMAWSQTAENWSGYGVFGIIDELTGTLTVAKCQSGRLSWIGNKTVSVFSTEADDLDAFRRTLGVKTGSVVPVAPCSVIQFDLETGNATTTTWGGFGKRSVDHLWAASMGKADLPKFRMPLKKSKQDDDALFPDFEPRTRTYKSLHQMTNLTVED